MCETRCPSLIDANQAPSIGRIPFCHRIHAREFNHCLCLLQVTLPVDALQGVYVPSPSAEVTVGPGFVADTFTASAPFSSLNLNVLSLYANTLHIQTTG
jgi:hypothetical protein